MFFYAAKIVWALAVPSTFLVLLAIVGGVLAATRFRRTGAATALLAGLLLLAIGSGPPGTWALLPLEERFPAYQDDGPVAGIVALGGGIHTEISAARGQLSLGEANERLTYMAELARRHPEARLVFAGGSGALVFEEVSEAESVRRFAGILGLDTSRILYDTTSRTTWENAVNARRLVEPKPGERWLLVTSARHMPRAIGCFRQAGFAVTAFPVDYLTTGPGELWPRQPTVALGLGLFDDAMREWVGLLVYRLTGRSSALFPSPSDGPIR